MKSYDISSDIKRIMGVLELTDDEFCKFIGVSRPTLAAALKSGVCSELLLEKVYSFAYEQGMRLNKSKEQLYKETFEKDILLFHGSREGIQGNIDLTYSKVGKDFGVGFYAGLSLTQAATWVAQSNESSVYCFAFENSQDLCILEFNVKRDWLYAILYFRNGLSDYLMNNEVKDVLTRISYSDLIIAPIADNEMYKTIDAFSRGEITDAACIHALSATNLGMQYVFKTEKAINRLSFVDRLYLCGQERNDFFNEKKAYARDGIEKAKLSLVEYRREGKYIDELFTKKR